MSSTTSLAPDASGLSILTDPRTGQVASVSLYGKSLLEPANPCVSELWVNGLPLALRPHRDPHDPHRALEHLKGERFVSHFAGWSLVLRRKIGERPNLPHRCVGIQTLVRREKCDQTCPAPGPGGPVIEAPLQVDTFGILQWHWRFWGDDTRMLFLSTHSNGPSDTHGHCGYENDTPETVKSFLQNTWRRTYPGVMAIPGGLFYNARTGHWLAITCRRPSVGYQLSLDAGRGVGYEFTLHAPFPLDECLPLPEIRLYFGRTHDEMMAWLGSFLTHYYEEPPAWVFRTLFGGGLAWNNRPTWTQQAEAWEAALADQQYSGIGYCLVTSRPVQSGTTPTSYAPDPLHGTVAEFRAACRRLSDKGVPILIWMSHSGLAYRGSPEIDDDWFIRGIDGRICASWGSVDNPELGHINPGHPGYLEYTKKWIRFYIKECGCKGIFMDCLGWVMPPDFKPRAFMRYPGDTNRLAIQFAEEIYACIKDCDPDAILLGEGVSLDMPVNVFSIHANPVRAQDGLGPRDFLLQLNRWSPKRLAIDQGPRLAPAAGFIGAGGPGWEAHNRALTRTLREHGAPGTFTHYPGDLSALGDLLYVPLAGKGEARARRLPEPWASATTLREQVTGATVTRAADGTHTLGPGTWRASG